MRLSRNYKYYCIELICQDPERQPRRRFGHFFRLNEMRLKKLCLAGASCNLACLEHGKDFQFMSSKLF